MSKVYQLKIQLLHISPTIWRRVLVPSDIDLHSLHFVLFTTMGWQGYHVHQYKIGDSYFGVPHEDDEDFGFSVMDDSLYVLEEIAPVLKFKFKYEYDMGDGWEHKITLEKIMPGEPTQKYPLCIDGENACPPEDCGGIPGFYNFVEAMEHPKHPEHAAMKEWSGGSFDPKKFELDAVNKRLQKVFRQQPKKRKTHQKTTAAALENSKR